MYKLILIILLIAFSVGNARSQYYTLATADTVTKHLFQEGNWDELIDAGNQILKKDIDFKTLRQRMGYAWLMKGNYLMSRWQYEKALKFDKADEISNLYLYYSGLNMSDEGVARYYAGKLSRETRQEMKIKTFRWVDAVDVEYNYKTGSTLYSRSAPNYTRLGIHSNLGFRLSLYQSISTFSQTYYSETDVRQNEYYALLSYNPTAALSVHGGYHYLASTVDTTGYKANMFFGKLAYKKHIFDGALIGSLYSDNADKYLQTGLHAGISVAPLKYLYAQTTIYRLSNSITSNWVYSGSVGLVPLRKWWIEASATLGNQKNFVDMNGIYVHNSADYSTSRVGGSLFFYPNKHLTLFGNYTYDTRFISDYDMNVTYNQHSITGGIIWKL